MGRKKFNDHPFAYHQEIELEIATLTNLGVGLGRVPLAGSLEPGTCDLELPPAKAGGAPDQVPLDPDLEPETCDLELPPARAGGGWVVMVPFALPGERVRVRIFRNHKNYSEADLVAVLVPSPHRVSSPRCPLFGRCGGCQYQHLVYAEQLHWKQRHVAELLLHLAGVEFAVAPVVPSPREFGYRSKITPHFHALPRVTEVPSTRFQVPNAKPQISNKGLSFSTAGQASGPDPTPDLSPHSPDLRSQISNLKFPDRPGAAAADFPIGFLRQGTRHAIVDVPRCEIATDAINLRLTELRAEVQARLHTFTRDGTLLLRDAAEGVTTDYSAVITETIPLAEPSAARVPMPVKGEPGWETCAPLGKTPDPPTVRRCSPAAPLRLRFLARDFFQNNPFILPAFAGYVRDQAAAGGASFLIDAYCGSGLFALAAAERFTRVAGIEVSETSVAFARENAAANGIANATFRAGDAAAIFAGVDFPPADTAVVTDPPRKGCDESFLQQLFAFGPRTVVYVSCDPATQMRDLKQFLAAGYELTAVQPFDLFPQTRHLECVITLRRSV